VLNAVTLAATPAMKAASSPVMAIPSIPLGRYLEIRMGTALLNCRSPVLAPSPFTVTAATSPGITTTNGMNSLGKAAISGVRRAADRFLAARARWTSAKLVVQ
jgi:hypothetical protein